MLSPAVPAKSIAKHEVNFGIKMISLSEAKWSFTVLVFLCAQNGLTLD